MLAHSFFNKTNGSLSLSVHLYLYYATLYMPKNVFNQFQCKNLLFFHTVLVQKNQYNSGLGF